MAAGGPPTAWQRRPAPARCGKGQSGNPYAWLLAIGGLAYLLAVAWFRWRG